MSFTEDIPTAPKTEQDAQERPSNSQSVAVSTILQKTESTVDRWLLKILSFLSFHKDHQTRVTVVFQPRLGFQSRQAWREHHQSRREVVMAGGELGIKLVFLVTRGQTCWVKGQFRKRCRPVSGRVRHSGQIGSLGQPSSADYQLSNSDQAQLTRRKIDTLEGHQSP
jgi:hypothetical protein